LKEKPERKLNNNKYKLHKGVIIDNTRQTKNIIYMNIQL